MKSTTFKWIFFIIGVLIAVAAHWSLYGTPEYAVRMLSKWWI